MSTNAPFPAFEKVLEMQKQARERKSDRQTSSNITADSQPSPQSKLEVSPSQRAFTEAQNELNKLIEENERLRNQVEDQAELKGRIVYLRRAYDQHHEITERFERFAFANSEILGGPPEFYVSPTPNTSPTWLMPAVYQGIWLRRLQEELNLAKQARDGNRKEKIALLESQIEQQQRELQASKAAASASRTTIRHLKRNNEELEEQVHQQEKKEKHFHQVLNHLENLIESHPGEAVEFKDFVIGATTDAAAAKKESSGWNGQTTRSDSQKTWPRPLLVQPSAARLSSRSTSTSMVKKHPMGLPPQKQSRVQRRMSLCCARPCQTRFAFLSSKCKRPTVQPPGRLLSM